MCCSYCLIHGTYSLHWDGEDFHYKDHTKDTTPTHHSYYVWVPLFTMIQAAISYLPHYLWYYWEGELEKGFSYLP